MAKDEKKKQEVTWKDVFAKRLSILGALLTVALLVPQLPWRKSRIDTNMGGRFNVARLYHPFWATNHMQQGVSWMKLKKDVCMEVQKMNTPNPIGLLVTVASTMTKTGGAIGGCFAWQACKDHVVSRCVNYSWFAMCGLICMFLQVVSIICSLCVPLCMNQEASCKKKKHKEEAAQKTMIVGIVAFCTSFLGAALWLGVTESGFRNLKQTGYYPWPALWFGAYVAFFGAFVQFLAMVFAIQRTRPDEDPKQAEGEQQGESMDGAGAAGMPPMGAMPYGGVPPGGAMPYDPMMGPPPPMGMGMGPPMGPPMMGPPPGGPPPY